MMKQIKPETPPPAQEAEGGLQYIQQAKPRWPERLARNLALAGILLLTVTAVRNAELPSGETVLTAVQGIIDAPWDESLGRISFVSGLLPEAVAVFLEAPAEVELLAPCFGELRHSYREGEPYLSYEAATGQVFAVAPGQVMSVAHGLEEERVIRLRHEDGLESMYYNLQSVNVKEGDQVTAQTCLGALLPGREAAIEVRRAGRPVNPTAWIASRKEAAP